MLALTFWNSILKQIVVDGQKHKVPSQITHILGL